MSYQPWLQRSFKRNKQQEALPLLMNRDKLSLGDLLKIQRSCAAYVSKKKRIDAENCKTTLLNEKVTQNNEANLQTENNYIYQYAKPIVELMHGVETRLYSLRSGVISGLWTEPITYYWESPSIAHYGKADVYFANRQCKIKNTSESANLIAQHKQAAEKLKRILEGRPSLPQQRLKDKLREPKNYAVLDINGSRMQVSFSDSILIEVNNLIDSHRSKIEKQKESIHEIKARAASKELETRQLAQALRHKLSKQLSILDCCPYCAGPLSLNDAHLDHIYPVSKGGQSSAKNLVLVCSSCNMKKRASTLRQFIVEQELDAGQVHKRLIALSKDF